MSKRHSQALGYKSVCNLKTLSASRLSRDYQVHWRKKLRNALGKKIF